MDAGDSAHQRKIELQSADDLAYLLANVRRAATAHLDEAFPPVEGAQGEDELRTQIEALVDEYITKTFDLAAPNLSINGLPVDAATLAGPSSSSRDPAEPEIVYAPFDARKRARVEELTRDEEDLLRDIAKLKKQTPAHAAAAWAAAAQAGLRGDDEALERAKQVDADADADGAGLAVAEYERQAELEKRYGEAVAGLERLKKDMPSVVARLERARGAGGYVVTER